MALLLTEFGVLRADVWEGYAQAIGLLKWMGFQETGWARPGFLRMVKGA